MTADNFSRNVFVSLVGHAAILVLVFIRAVFVPSEPMEISRAIRADMVDLPRKMTEFTPPAAAPEPAAKPEPVKEVAPPKPEPAKPETVVLNKDAKPKKVDKAAQERAIRKLKAEAALAAMKQDVSKEKAARPTSPIAGNKLAAGNALTGLDRIDDGRYKNEITEKLQANWILPQWLAERELKAKARIFIDERGYVIGKKIEQSSGNPDFDAKVLDTIDASSPFPVPPANLREKIAVQGVAYAFPIND